MRGRLIAGIAAVVVVAALGLWFVLAGGDEPTGVREADAPALTARPVDPAAAAEIDEAPFLVIPTELVVQLADGQDLDAFRAVIGDLPVEIVGYVPLFQLVQVEVPAERREALMAELRALPQVAGVAHQIVFEPDAQLNDPALNSDDANDAWGLVAIHAPEAWDITRGDPDVVIAVVDAGTLLDHEELRDKIVLGTSAESDDGSHVGDADQLEHGTHVASIAAGRGDNGVGTSGVCPDCSLMAVQSGVGLINMYDGIAFAAQNGAGVINLSMGPRLPDALLNAFYDPDRRADAIAELRAYQEDFESFDGLFYGVEEAGSVMIVSAGNDAIPGDFNPFCRNAVTLCVGNAGERVGGAINASPSSNYGFTVRVSAPGFYIYGAIAEPGGAGYDFLSGTSMSAPMVSGLAGLILSKYPDLTPQQVRRAIIVSARRDPEEPRHPPLYAPAGLVQRDVEAWTRAFNRLAGRPEDTLMPGLALQVLSLYVIPPEVNAVWQHSQRQLGERAWDDDLLCADGGLDAEAWYRAYDEDRCYRAIGGFIDAPAALAAAGRDNDDAFAAYTFDELIAAAEAMDPMRLTRLASLIHAAGRYDGSDATGGPFVLQILDDESGLAVVRDTPPGAGYAEWLIYDAPGQFAHQATLDGVDYGQSIVFLNGTLDGIRIDNLLRGEALEYKLLTGTAGQ